MNTGDLEEMAGLVSFHVGAWEEFGYAEPPAPECATIPPLGERSAAAIRAGHEAVGDIDRLIARLHEVRAQLVSELRQDEDIRAARVDAMLAGRRKEAPCDGDLPGEKDDGDDMEDHKYVHYLRDPKGDEAAHG